jgi:CubicO group peptidase (beta-lactamase class C family)
MGQGTSVRTFGKWSVLVLGACLELSVRSRAADDPDAASFRSAFEARFPKTETSAAALEIESLAARLGIEMAPFESPEATADQGSSGDKNAPVPFVLKPRRDRPGPSPELERSLLSAGASEFVNRELGIPDDRIGAPPPQLVRYLEDNESGVAAIESLLLREPEIRWEVDVTKYPNGPLPNLTGVMRLQRLLAARALVKGGAGETDAALRTLDAAWRLNEVLSSRPELISQLIVVAAAKIHVGVLRKLDSAAYGWADRLRSRRFYSAYLTAFQSEAWADPGLQDLTGREGTFGRILREVAEELSDRDICSWTRGSLEEAWTRAVHDQSREEAPFASAAAPHLFETIDRWRRFLVDAELTALVLDARAERAASRRRAWPGRLPAIGTGVCPGALWTYRAAEDGTATFAFEGRIAETAAPGFKLPLRFTAGSPDAPVPRPEPLDLYVEEMMRRTGVPGAAVVIVQNGRTIYAKGFGVRELKKQDPVTPDTLMMIGSTGKSMTTMMMATLVDEGKVTWETPAAAIYPEFAVGDPALTPRITLRKTVCNCTGMARHDLEMYFASQTPTGEEVVRSLRTFLFAGEFGRTFGYVNQMVGAGGYIAAWAARGSSTDLYANYLAQMQSRVFGPIGMTSTTFSFDRALANSNRATPHGQTVAGEYRPISLDIEKRLTPIAPAGSSWSTGRDIARYLITQLNRGVAPDGKRVVSAENLKATWQPQVEIGTGVSYGLGWAITRYKSRTLLTHGGGTSGFSADLTLLPDEGLGIAVLNNAQNANLFCGAVRSRAMEFALGEPPETDTNLAKRMEDVKRQLHEKAAKVRPADPAAITPYLATYANPSLGIVTLKLAGRKPTFAAGGFSSELRRLGNGDDAYVLADPPLAGALIRVSRSADGRRSFVLDADDPDIPEKYSFSEVR